MSKKQFGANSEDFKQTLQQVQAWAQNYKSADDIPDSEVPEAYDFSDINGYDFTGKIRDQGACGSCYTVSFTQLIESRLKMKYGKEVE